MARPQTPLMRLEDSRVEWPSKRRALMAQGQAELACWMDGLVGDLTTVIDSTRMILTILGCAEMVYAETVRERFEELLVRQTFRRVL